MNSNTVYLGILTLRQKIQRGESKVQITVCYMLNQYSLGAISTLSCIQLFEGKEILPIKNRSNDEINLKERVVV